MSDVERARAWEASPSGLLTLGADGTILDANATFLAWVGRERHEIAGSVRLSQLLSVGGRIYWETHLGPMLHVDGRVDEVAIELSTPAGRMPVLLTAVVADGATTAGSPTVAVALSGARERSRYERELLAARRESDRSAERTRVLLGVASALSGAGPVSAVVSSVLDAATTDLGAAAATVWIAEPSGELRPHVASGEAAAHAPRPSVALGERDAQLEAGRVVVPLRGRTRLQGVLSVVPHAGPGAEPPDLDVLTAVGQQAGLALDRAILYEQSARVALQLQRALLATETPQDERFAVTTSYRPGVATLEVGGDWYDAFLVDDGVLAIVVGDVVGRGLQAAIAMGQLRSAVRAVAAPGVGPAGVLTHLDRFVQQVDAALSATVVYAEVQLATGRLRYACAGHLPPLRIPSDGAAHLLWGGRSRPLGVVVPGTERPEEETVLAPGDQLMLYTDGLVERRDRSLRTGLEVLRETADDVRALPPARAVAELTARLLRDEQGSDDVCVLLLSCVGGPENC